MTATFLSQPHQCHEIYVSKADNVLVRTFGQVDYQDSYAAMSEFAANRKEHPQDEIWLLQHPPVYTQGTACDMQAILPSSIPVIKTDRGGQITYHGPGQLVMYPLLELRRYAMGVKSLVYKLEQTVINILQIHDVIASRKADAPGVYVNQAKIAALGLRIRRGTSYHGLSVNLNMDLTPFDNIDPCGYQGLKVCQVSDFGEIDTHRFGDQLVEEFVRQLGASPDGG